MYIYIVNIYFPLKKLLLEFHYLNRVGKILFYL